MAKPTKYITNNGKVRYRVDPIYKGKRLGSKTFDTAAAHAVYKVHKEKCYICGNALTMRTCQVDHVIPESIADNAAALEEACAQLGRPSGFEVNSYENWLPACGPCNVEKLAKVWDPSLQVQNALQQAADRAEKARNIESELTNDRKLTNALSIVLAAAEDDAFTAEMIESLMPLLAFQTQHRELELEGAPIRFAPFLEVDSYRFDTTANLAKIPGSDDEMIDMGNEFFVQGARLTDFMVRVSWKPPTTGGRARYLHMDVYKEQPKYEGPHRGSLGDGSSLIILTTGKTGMCEIDGYQVSIQSWQQDAGTLWIVLSTSGPSIYT